VSELLDYHPLDGCMPFEDQKWYVKLRYAVVASQKTKHELPAFINS
jgi:hypothetical protein